MVFAVRILHRTGLSAHLQRIDIIPATCTVSHYLMHALSGESEPVFVHACLMTQVGVVGEFGVEVRGYVIAAVSECSGLVSKLQRRNQNLTLTDTERADRDGFPAFLTVSAVVFPFEWNLARRLFADVGVRESATQTELHHIVAPEVVARTENRIVITKTVALQHVVERTPEVRVTTLLDGTEQIHGRAVVVGTLDRCRARTVAGELAIRIDATFLQTDDSLNSFERRAGRVHSLCGAVQKRFARVVEQAVILRRTLFADKNLGIPSG